MLKRIMSGAGANAYNQFITVIIQLASLPLFLSVWDIETYGVWIALSTIPAYIILSDVGMVTATGNRLNMLLAQGQVDEANRVFQSSLVFMLMSCTAVTVTISSVLYFINIPEHLKIPAALLSLSALLALFGGLADAIYRATYRYAYSTFIASNIRLLEWFGLMAGLWYGRVYLYTAIGSLLARSLGTVFLILNSRGNHGIQWGIQAASWPEVKVTIKPAIAFMAFPVTNALSIQGVSLVVASVLGPGSLVIFNTYRTIARVTVQATSVVSYAFWPEFTRLYANDPDCRLPKFYSGCFWFGVAMAIVGSCVIFLLSSFVLDYWSKGKVEFYPYLMAGIMLYASMDSISHVPGTLIMATSQHGRLAIGSLCIACLTVASAYIVSLIYMSLSEVAVTLALCHGVLASYTVLAARSIMEKNC